jgi:hypothetical protein
VENGFESNLEGKPRIFLEDFFDGSGGSSAPCVERGRRGAAYRADMRARARKRDEKRPLVRVL